MSVMEPRIIAFVSYAAARAGFMAMALVVASGASAAPATFEPCTQLPAGVVALGGAGEPETFGVSGGVTAATFASPTDASRSVLVFARGDGKSQSVPLAGRVLGLALSGDGRAAFAIVRMLDRKGVLRSVELTRVDLATGRDAQAATLPATARGLAFSRGGSTLLVAARNEIRSFQLPNLASGPLYRVLGDNVGLVPVGEASQVLVAQPTRVVRADLAGTQGRDGLTLSDETLSPGPLGGLMAVVGDLGAVALGGPGERWCVRGGTPSEPPPVPTAVVEAAPTAPPDAPAAVPADAPAAVTPEPPPPAAVPPPSAAAPEPEAPAASESPVIAGESGTVSGRIEGPSVADVAAIVWLGPDNILKEAARAVPDERGRFSVSGLAPGSYRMVAAGKGGRVLLCDPAFITVHVGGNGAVEAPVMKVLHAP